MGRLTGDMTRLHSEIVASRSARRELKRGLTAGAKNLKNNVSTMRSGFRNAHKEMGKKTKADRLAFLSKLKHTVGGLRREFTNDLAGARRVWMGKTR